MPSIGDLMEVSSTLRKILVLVARQRSAYSRRVRKKQNDQKTFYKKQFA